MKLAIAFGLLVLASTSLAQPARIVRDEPRNNLWVLQPDAVYLHDTTSRALKKRYELPGWLHVGDGYACPPDLALDARGAVVVSSNVVPMLWRVDPLKSEVAVHELVLDADGSEDVGFTGLVYAADQDAFFAVSSVYGSLWRIDPGLRRAQKIPLSSPLREGCGLSVERTKTRRTLVLCVRGPEGGWTVHLAPDQRSAYVSSKYCGQDSSL
jgi:hypothetical protein